MARPSPTTSPSAAPLSRFEPKRRDVRTVVKGIKTLLTAIAEPQRAMVWKAAALQIQAEEKALREKEKAARLKATEHARAVKVKAAAARAKAKPPAAATKPSPTKRPVGRKRALPVPAPVVSAAANGSYSDVSSRNVGEAA